MELNLIGIYQEILVGKRKTFPKGTWEPSNGGFDNIRRLLRWLTLEKLNYTRSEILDNINQKFINKWKLRSSLLLFDSSTYELVKYVFPEFDIQPWETNRTPKDYWNPSTVKDCVRMIINERLKFDRQQITSELTQRTFIKFKVSTIITNYFDSMFDLMSFCFPEYDFKWWEFSENKGKRTDDEIKEVLRDLIEDKLNWDYEDIRKNLTLKTFKDNNLYNFFRQYFEFDLEVAMNFLYPNEDWTVLHILKKSRNC